ncbi:MAG TPA: hypothetical protein VHC90_00455 [Bryobacteraceae bacterium]|nr:hypothetical protein [Bryobacteraceae bacterium]
MRTMIGNAALVTILALPLCLAPNAKASALNEKTTFTFNQPVEVPGQVLPAGTYVFKIADIQSDRDVVQIFNKSENHLYGTFLTIPDRALKQDGKSIINFRERNANSPEAVKAWFYPEDRYAHEFVYPKTRAVALAKANNENVPSMPDNLSANTKEPAKTMNDASVTAMKQAPLKAEKPTGEEVTVIEVFPAAAQPTNASSKH